jgi:hypothetical protein
MYCANGEILFQEVSYSPMLVPSRSFVSMVNFSNSSETLNYFASGPSSTSSAYGPTEVAQPSSASTNLLAVEGTGQLAGSKHDASSKSWTAFDGRKGREFAYRRPVFCETAHAVPVVQE